MGIFLGVGSQSMYCHVFYLFKGYQNFQTDHLDSLQQSSIKSISLGIRHQKHRHSKQDKPNLKVQYKYLLAGTEKMCLELIYSRKNSLVTQTAVIYQEVGKV